MFSEDQAPADRRPLLQLFSCASVNLKDSNFLPTLRQKVEEDGSCSDWALEDCGQVCMLQEGCTAISHSRVSLRGGAAGRCLLIDSKDGPLSIHNAGFEGMVLYRSLIDLNTW